MGVLCVLLLVLNNTMNVNIFPYFPVLQTKNKRKISC